MSSVDFLKCIIQLTENTIGLKSQLISLFTWEWAVKQRMTACHLLSYEEYYCKLELSKDEFQELIELIVVPETWFFRDKGALDFLVDLINKKPFKQKYLKILSLPCSTGEEPYSIVMALFDNKRHKASFIIDALDISKKSLRKAEMGVYGKNSFRGKDLSYRESYFEKINEAYAIQASIQEQVHFHYGNVLDENLAFVNHSYQIIFCRNLLIYLDEQAQQKTFELIRNLLVPEGILIVGPAEIQLARQAGFFPIGFNQAYAFYLDNHSVSLIPPIANLSQQAFGEIIKQQAHPSIPPVVNATLQKANISSLKEKDRDVPEKVALLQQATKLADEGDFEIAIDLCLKYMTLYGAQAEIYYLLGLIQHAIGNELKAEEFFQKTIYLKPAHYEALIYLALLFEKKGDSTKADLFRKRAHKTYTTI